MFKMCICVSFIPPTLSLFILSLPHTYLTYMIKSNCLPASWRKKGLSANISLIRTLVFTGNFVKVASEITVLRYLMRHIKQYIIQKSTRFQL